ncbi:MAG: F0F1 ATP synthase subunit delta [Gammaproteobacteria bacterium]|nr:F0F1 ATP synthase subunit delta [Gammaproteobacteria bacterium]
MAAETSTIARPYAEAIFSRAEETGSLDQWSEKLAFLAALVKDSLMSSVISDPLFGRQNLTALVLDTAEERLDEEGANLVKLLVQNDRLQLTPEILALFEHLKSESQRVVKVHVRSAFALQPAQELNIANALKARLGRDIVITTEQDPSLIGGVHIRAGDMVIDGSVSGHLQKLSNELGI